MDERRVRRTGKDSDGDITKLCGDWGSVTKAVAIDHIQNSIYKYFVDEAGYRTDVHVVKRDGRRHLQTTADSTSKNNLDNLEDC